MLRLSPVSKSGRSGWILGSFPLLGRRSLKYIPYPCCLLFKELCILCTLLAPGWVKGGSVLVHKVGVFGATRTSKVLDLKEEWISYITQHTTPQPQFSILCFVFSSPCVIKDSHTCMTLGRMVLLKWSSRVGALKSLLYTSSSSSCGKSSYQACGTISHIFNLLSSIIEY